MDVFLENGLLDVGRVCLGQEASNMKGFLKGERAPWISTLQMVVLMKVEGWDCSQPRLFRRPLCLLLIDEALVKEVIRFLAKGDVNFRLQFV